LSLKTKLLVIDTKEPLSPGAISRHSPSLIPVSLVRSDLVENGAYGTARNSGMALLMGQSMLVKIATAAMETLFLIASACSLTNGTSDP